jgi:hypothetical protein
MFGGFNVPCQSTPRRSNSTHGSDKSSETEVTPRNGPWNKPPAVKSPYDPQNACDDLPSITYALNLFLDSYMVESEEYCNEVDPEKYVSSPLQDSRM